MRAPLPIRLAGLAILSAAAAPAAALALAVPVDHAVRVQVAGPASSVVVGNAAIADVSVVDTHTIYISGKDIGQTDVVVLDSFGRPLYTSSIEVTSEGPGRIAVYRGAQRTDFACAPSCAQDNRHNASAAAGGAGGAPAAAPAAH